MATTEDTARYGDLCRLCATKTNLVLGINIFDSEGSMRQVNKKIESCLPIQVHESDGLPKMICENCLYKLELFFDFRERAMRTENILINLFKEISASKLLPEDQQMVNVSGIDHQDMIMIPHHQLIQNVNDLDLSQLQQRDMIVEHEIILSQQAVALNTHSLTSLDLNHQEAILNEGSLHLIPQEELLSEQYRLEHSLPVNDGGTHLNNDQNQHVENIHTTETNYTTKEEKPLSQIKMEDEDLEKGIVKAEHFATAAAIECSEDSLVIDDRLEEANESSNSSVGSSKMYLMSNENTGLTSSSANATNDDEWLHCNMCGRSFNEKLEFQIHYEYHFNKCAVCLAVFTNQDALNLHKKEMHGIDAEEKKVIKTRLKRATVPVKKDNSFEELNSDSEDGINNVEDEDDNDYSELNPEGTNIKRKRWTPKECKECGKSYKTNYKLAEHMRKHTGEKPYKCGSCDKAFRSKIGLAQHEAKHTGQYDLSCPTCGKGFQCKSYLMVHQRVHSDVKPYPCTTCGRNFKTKQSLLDHTNRHLGVKPFMCDICGRGFITKGLCKAHQKVHTGLDNRKFSCKVCNKKFVSKSYLQTHLRIHTGEKPFMCEVCGKGFLTRVDLRIHSTMHTGEKSYVCEMCGKAFARRDALRCHRRSHTGERPYSCDQCGQTFTQFSPMAIHKRLHTGERPYSCEVCGKAFVSRSIMMAHWKKHVR